MAWLEQIRQIFQPPSAEVMALRQLEDAKRYLLKAHAYREEAEATVQMYEERITRLTLTVQAVGSTKT